MGPGSAIAAVLLAAGVTSAGGRTLLISRKSRPRANAKRRDTRRKSRETAGG
jgi:hypothetical protein